MKKIILLFITLILATTASFSQDALSQDRKKYFFFDAVSFNNTEDSLSRVDVFIMVPYETMKFMKKDEIFVSSFEIIVEIIDQNGKKAKEELISRKVTETDYFVAQGGTGGFDLTQKLYSLEPGKYDIDITIQDRFSSLKYKRSRKIVVLDYKSYPFSLSGILLVSSIEEKDGKYVITPYLAENVGELADGFFAFFESYNETSQKEVDLVYRIINNENVVYHQSKRIRKDISSDINRMFIKIDYPENTPQGKYILRIIALKPSENESFTESDYLAVTERSLKIYPSITGFVLLDMDLAIEQLIYIAIPEELEYIEAAPNEEEQQKRFKEFWKKKDPTPATERNEAFEQYYNRIKIANAKFRTYTKGWRSDQGMVFIIYGPPYNIERTSRTTDGRIYERWTYSNNREFIFVDNSGFGDFRLFSPMTVNERYKYSR